MGTALCVATLAGSAEEVGEGDRGKRRMESIGDSLRLNEFFTPSSIPQLTQQPSTRWFKQPLALCKPSTRWFKHPFQDFAFLERFGGLRKGRSGERSVPPSFQTVQRAPAACLSRGSSAAKNNGMPLSTSFRSRPLYSAACLGPSTSLPVRNTVSGQLGLDYGCAIATADRPVIRSHCGEGVDGHS